MSSASGTFFFLRERSDAIIEIRIPNQDDFWKDFIRMTRELDFIPLSKMDNYYFFQHRWLGFINYIILHKKAEDVYCVSYPSSYRKLIKKHLGVYNKILQFKDNIDP